MVVVGVLGRGGGGCLVKVGGVDTEMYRTGHPHACSLNLTTFCCRSCCCGESGTGFHTEPRNETKKRNNGMFPRSPSERSVSTEHWRRRSFTMSCLDVMYPAYGHYAPYAPTAPAFINRLQVGSEPMWPGQFLWFSVVAGDGGGRWGEKLGIFNIIYILGLT